ncbi:MAG: 2,4-dienoyl-CoA reductase-like NADH-dependent reductase (Old Yellow Enzyme family) [Myxococcota bacterium]|jgi:2,4-dienoyl-CoA reductase-like NADH-dependent reductase (Old Yellow Enzyme family)
MSTSTLFSPLAFLRGPTMRNRFMLAPLTNLQSHPDGVLSDDEFKWLTMRARGGFGSTMTCAAHIQAKGQGFPGQLGVFADKHLEGLTRLAKEIRGHESVALLQLHHAGMRSPKDLIGETPVCPSANDETGARELSLAEVEALIEDFVAAAVRAEKAGFDGVEIHGAHGYIVCQFLSAEINHREDQYGGSLENRSRLLFEIIDGVRARCRPDFSVGVRLSAERFGIELDEALQVAQRLMDEAKIDFLDMSMWDVFKQPAEEKHQGKSLLEHFTALKRGDVRLGVAGKVYGAKEARACMEAGVDFVLAGRAAILHHDLPERIRANADFEVIQIPVTPEYLRAEGLGDAFVEYMGTWKGFVEPAQVASS